MTTPINPPPPPWDTTICAAGSTKQCIDNTLDYFSINDIIDESGQSFLEKIKPDGPGNVEFLKNRICPDALLRSQVIYIMPGFRGVQNQLKGFKDEETCRNNFYRVNANKCYTAPANNTYEGDYGLYKNCPLFINLRLESLGLPTIGQYCACTRWRSCFAPGTQIRLANQSNKAIEEIKVGDEVWNPVLKKGVVVKNVIEGPEEKPLIEIGAGDNTLKVSDGHPVVTKNGIKKAIELSIGDLVKTTTGEFEEVKSIRKLSITRGQRVINLELQTESPLPEEHLLLSDGIVTGDVTLQSQVNSFYSPFVEGLQHSK